MTDPVPEFLASSKLVVGIPTVPRERDYLRRTVDSIVDGVPANAWDRVELVLFNATDAPDGHPEIPAITERHAELVASGHLTLIDNPDGYALLDGRRETGGLPLDASPGLRWRCKLVLDFVRLARFCARRGDYYLHIEDDSIAAPNFLEELTAWFDDRYASSEDWAFLTLFRLDRIPDHHVIDPDEFGSACALLFRCADLDRIADFCEERFLEKPLDFILGDYIRADGRPVHAMSPPLVQHVGLFSSFDAEVRPLQALAFRERWLTTLRRAVREAAALLRREPTALFRFLRWRVAILFPALHRLVRSILKSRSG